MFLFHFTKNFIAIYYIKMFDIAVTKAQTILHIIIYLCKKIKI